MVRDGNEAVIYSYMDGTLRPGHYHSRVYLGQIYLWYLEIAYASRKPTLVYFCRVFRCQVSCRKSRVVGAMEHHH